MNEFNLSSLIRHEVHIVQAHTVCTRQVDKNSKTERFTTLLEAEP